LCALLENEVRVSFGDTIPNMETHRITLSELPTFAQIIKKLIENLLPEHGAAIMTLRGEVGAGKTTFMQHIGQSFGISETIISPTFVVMKVYQLDHELFDRLVHIDAYRIEDEAELVPIHVTEMLQTSRTLVCVEWPEHIPSLKTIPHHNIQISIINDVTREFLYEYKKAT